MYSIELPRLGPRAVFRWNSKGYHASTPILPEPAHCLAEIPSSATQWPAIRSPQQDMLTSCPDGPSHVSHRQFLCSSPAPAIPNSLVSSIPVSSFPPSNLQGFRDSLLSTCLRYSGQDYRRRTTSKMTCIKCRGAAKLSFVGAGLCFASVSSAPSSKT
jgi:hypothetical protein